MDLKLVIGKLSNNKTSNEQRKKEKPIGPNVPDYLVTYMY